MFHRATKNRENNTKIVITEPRYRKKNEAELLTIAERLHKKIKLRSMHNFIYISEVYWRYADTHVGRHFI